MQTGPPQAVPLWPLVVYFVAVLILLGGMLGLSHILGQRHKPRETDAVPYESGMTPTGPAQTRFDVLFFLNAMFFVVFDLETMFILAWAVAFRDAGWAGFIEILIFIVFLVAALVYLWKEGALDWQTTREKILTRVRQARVQNVNLHNPVTPPADTARPAGMPPDPQGPTPPR